MIPALALPSAASAADNCAAGDPAIDAEEASFLTVINSYRAQNGAGALVISPQLNRSAAWMVADMGTKGYFAHTDSLGRSPWARIADCGYSAAGGENLAAGTNRSTAQAAFELFRGSPSHNENMIAPDFRFIGIARAYAEGSTYSWYWATTFGYNPRPEAPPPAPAPVAPPPPPEPPPPPAAAAQVQSQAAPPTAEPVLASEPEVIQPPGAAIDLTADAEASATLMVNAASRWQNAAARFVGRGAISFRSRQGRDQPARNHGYVRQSALLAAVERLTTFTSHPFAGRPSRD